MDILDKIENKINEAVSKEKLMRHIRWEEFIYNFFNTYDFFMSSDAKNYSIKNGQKEAEKAMSFLGEFFDSIPTLDIWRKKFDLDMKKKIGRD